MNRRIFIPKLAQRTVMSFAVAYGIILSFALLIEEFYALNEPNAFDNGFRIVIGQLPLLYCLGAISLLAASLVIILFSQLGNVGAMVSVIAALAGVAVDAQYEFFEAGLFPSSRGILLCVVLIMVGAVSGSVITARCRGARYLWVPLVELLGATAGMWVITRMY